MNQINHSYVPIGELFLVLRLMFGWSCVQPDLLRPAAGQVEAELKDFSPCYRRQFSIARFLQVEDDLEQRKQKTTQLLMQKVPQVWRESFC